MNRWKQMTSKTNRKYIIVNVVDYLNLIVSISLKRTGPLK